MRRYGVLYQVPTVPIQAFLVILLVREVLVLLRHLQIRLWMLLIRYILMSLRSM